MLKSLTFLGLVVAATGDACSKMNAILAPYKQQLGNGATWQQIVSAAINAGELLNVSGKVNWPAPASGPWNYNSFGVACHEVMLDVLTGEYQLMRTDILMDAGISLNPALDIGQVEGAYTMGLGYYLTEEITYDETGALINNGTWEYKPPRYQHFSRLTFFSALDIPIDLRVTLLKNSPNPNGVMSAKGVGEPPLCLSAGAFVTIKRAISSARSLLLQAFANKNVEYPYVPMDAPATPDKVHLSIGVSPSMFLLS
jgi:xanthine dehydrogenase/oxidase